MNCGEEESVGLQTTATPKKSKRKLEETFDECANCFQKLEEPCQCTECAKFFCKECSYPLGLLTEMFTDDVSYCICKKHAMQFALKVMRETMISMDVYMKKEKRGKKEAKASEKKKHCVRKD